MYIIDGHLDIAMNALMYDRDFTQSAYETRKKEGGRHPQNGECTVGLPEMLKAKIFMAMATIWAKPARKPKAEGYHTPQEAYDQGLKQLQYYKDLAEHETRVKLITDLKSLNENVEGWKSDNSESESESESKKSIGLIILMEGADPIISPSQAAEWYEAGVRVIGLSWGKTRYAGGTYGGGLLTDDGKKLLSEMKTLGLILDVSHLNDESFFKALDSFDGHVIASHSNCRALIPGPRQITDEMIRLLIERYAVIGTVMACGMLYPDWKLGHTDNSLVTLRNVTDHIDHVCQLAGNAEHAAIGSDLDGGFGKEQSPSDLDTIADLTEIADILAARGYTESDVSKIMYENWLNLFKRAWGKK